MKNYDIKLLFYDLNLNQKKNFIDTSDIWKMTLYFVIKCGNYFEFETCVFLYATCKNKSKFLNLKMFSSSFRTIWRKNEFLILVFSFNIIKEVGKKEKHWRSQTFNISSGNQENQKANVWLINCIVVLRKSHSRQYHFFPANRNRLFFQYIPGFSSSSSQLNF